MIDNQYSWQTEECVVAEDCHEDYDEHDIYIFPEVTRMRELADEEPIEEI